MKKTLFLTGVALFFVCLSFSAEAGTAKFPVEVSIESSARYLKDTEVFIINLKSTPVTVGFAYYGNDGVKATCSPIPPSITIGGNDTWTLRVGGCFAVAIPMPPLNLVTIGEITSPPRSVSVYWRIYDVSGEKDVLMDHGKELP
ncbi:MAG: hypothetical protein EHM36_02380 [Deltaproteobacteria bacterium]|nr:MAG: hypothetical protein EHM36_02380 [Deltaproteobacteria bacterium]